MYLSIICSNQRGGHLLVPKYTMEDFRIHIKRSGRESQTRHLVGLFHEFEKKQKLRILLHQSLRQASTINLSPYTASPKKCQLQYIFQVRDFLFKSLYLYCQVSTSARCKCFSCGLYDREGLSYGRRIPIFRHSAAFLI